MDSGTETTRTPVLPSPYAKLLGIDVLAFKDGHSLVEMAANPALANRHGGVHGGAIAGLLDTAMAMAARSSFPPGSATATIMMSITFLATGEGKLVARGRVVRTGRTIAAVEATVEDEKGTLVAQAISSFRAIRPKEDALVTPTPNST